MLKYAPEIAWRGARNRVEKFRKSRGKVEEIAQKNSENRVEKQRKSHRKGYQADIQPMAGLR